MVWLNVDRPSKKCTLHADYSCLYLEQKKESNTKGVGKLKRNGGWLSFDSEKEAIAYHQSNHPKYEFVDHC